MFNFVLVYAFGEPVLTQSQSIKNKKGGTAY